VQGEFEIPASRLEEGRQTLGCCPSSAFFAIRDLLKFLWVVNLAIQSKPIGGSTHADNAQENLRNYHLGIVGFFREAFLTLRKRLNSEVTIGNTPSFVSLLHPLTHT